MILQRKRQIVIWRRDDTTSKWCNHFICPHVSGDTREELFVVVLITSCSKDFHHFVTNSVRSSISLCSWSMTPWLQGIAVYLFSSIVPLSKCGHLLFMAPVSNQTLLELAQNKSFARVVFLFILWLRNAIWHKQWLLAIILVRFCGGGLGSPNCGQFQNR